MFFVYFAIIGTIIVAILGDRFLWSEGIETFALCIVSAIAVLSVIFPPTEGLSFDTTEMTTYSLVSLQDVMGKDYKKNEYLVYNINEEDDFVFYYKDENGILREGSVDKDDISIGELSNVGEYIILKQDYSNGFMRHMFRKPDSIHKITIPKGSSVSAVVPDFNSQGDK